MTQPRLAVLLDADNVSHQMLKKILSESAKFGVINTKRIYGDWTSKNMAGWKDKIAENAMTPIQQFSNTVGKNATDSALIIDAMDLLHSNRIDAFCLVSSDGDFTKLASRIREQGLLVYGMGESKTPKSLVNACNQFVYFENILIDTDASAKGATTSTQKTTTPDQKTKKLIEDLFEQLSQDGKAVNISALKLEILKIMPEFDNRSYGFRQFGKFLEFIGYKRIEIDGSLQFISK